MEAVVRDPFRNTDALGGDVIELNGNRAGKVNMVEVKAVPNRATDHTLHTNEPLFDRE